MRNILFLLLSVTIFNCSSNQTSSVREGEEIVFSKASVVMPLQIDAGEEEGWGADIRISIVEKAENNDAHFYKALSLYKGKELGFLVSIPKAKEGNKGFGEGITLKSVGVPSNNLLQSLYELYNQTEDTLSSFVDHITVSYVNLKSFAKAVSGLEPEHTAANEYKLFFEGQSDEEYAELYLNVNADGNWLELREKDEEYRPIILRFLRQ
jgi:hypothetical protein